MTSPIDVVDLPGHEFYSSLLAEGDFHLPLYPQENPTNDTGLEFDCNEWLDFSECSPSTPNTASSCADPFTPFSDSTIDTSSSYAELLSPLTESSIYTGSSYADPSSPLSESSVYRNQSPSEMEDVILASELDSGGVVQLEMRPPAKSGTDPTEWEEGYVNKWFDKNGGELPYTPTPSPTTPLAPSSPSPSGTAYSPQASPCPTKKSIGPIRHRKRAIQSPNAPRNHPCPFPGCTISCRRRCDLTKHSRRHEKPYKCDNCDSRFSTVKDCERHDLSKHRPEDHLRCSFADCQHWTARKDNMADHVRRRHT